MAVVRWCFTVFWGGMSSALGGSAVRAERNLKYVSGFYGSSDEGFGDSRRN